MESRKLSLGLAAVAVVVAVVLFVVLRDGGSDLGGSSATNPAAPGAPERRWGRAGRGGGGDGPSRDEPCRRSVLAPVKPVGGVRT